jgi:hypothetical protein
MNCRLILTTATIISTEPTRAATASAKPQFRPFSMPRSSPATNSSAMLHSSNTPPDPQDQTALSVRSNRDLYILRHVSIGLKECLGSSQIAVLTQHDVHQSAIAIDRSIQIPPLATAEPDVNLSAHPAPTNLPTTDTLATNERTQSAAGKPALVVVRRQAPPLPFEYRIVTSHNPAVRWSNVTGTEAAIIRLGRQAGRYSMSPEQHVLGGYRHTSLNHWYCQTILFQPCALRLRLEHRSDRPRAYTATRIFRFWAIGTNP